MYHPYSYEGFIDISSVKDPDERAAYETHIREFGQTPRQIFMKPHPRKGFKTEKVPAFLGNGGEELAVEVEEKKVGEPSEEVPEPKQA